MNTGNRRRIPSSRARRESIFALGTFTVALILIVTGLTLFYVDASAGAQTLLPAADPASAPT